MPLLRPDTEGVNWFRHHEKNDVGGHRHRLIVEDTCYTVTEKGAQIFAREKLLNGPGSDDGKFAHLLGLLPAH